MPVSERLKSREVFARLATEGASMRAGSFRLRSLDADLNGPPFQVAFTVPKRFMKRAVDRNRIKRLMRESFRQLRPELYEAMEVQGKKASFLFVYQGRQLPTSTQVAATMKTLVTRWIESECAR